MNFINICGYEFIIWLNGDAKLPIDMLMIFKLHVKLLLRPSCIHVTNTLHCMYIWGIVCIGRVVFILMDDCFYLFGLWHVVVALENLISQWIT